MLFSVTQTLRDLPLYRATVPTTVLRLKCLPQTLQKHGRFLKDFDLFLGPVQKQIILSYPRYLPHIPDENTANTKAEWPAGLHAFTHCGSPSDGTLRWSAKAPLLPARPVATPVAPLPRGSYGAGRPSGPVGLSVCTSMTVRTQRKPSQFIFVLGSAPLRWAGRMLGPLSIHPPPRKAFYVPRSGPLGFRSGAFL
jgi:hypothetical protein